MKDPHDIILRPVLTEKAYEGIGDKRYIFEVAIDANKTEIKLALESIFAEDGVKVEKVNTINVRGRWRRQGLHGGYTAASKKAIVTLKEGSKGIDFFESMV